MNSADFPVKLNGKDLPKGSYAVFAVIGTMTVPLQAEDANKKLQPATITVADPKAAQEKGDQQAGNEKAKLDVDLRLKMKTDASEEKSTTSPSKKTKSTESSTAGAGKK